LEFKDGDVTDKGAAEVSSNGAAAVLEGAPKFKSAPISSMTSSLSRPSLLASGFRKEKSAESEEETEEVEADDGEEGEEDKLAVA
jgi:hypothetical protein